jgi:hypothetical protein
MVGKPDLRKKRSGLGESIRQGESIRLKNLSRLGLEVIVFNDYSTSGVSVDFFAIPIHSV